MIYKILNNKYFLISISTIVMVFVVGIVVTFVISMQSVIATHEPCHAEREWRDPTAPPTGGNVAIPINALSEGQEKAGGIGLCDGLRASERIGIGIDPVYPLDVNGNIKIRGSNGIIFSYDDGITRSIKKAPPPCKASQNKYLTWENGTWECKTI